MRVQDRERGGWRGKGGGEGRQGGTEDQERDQRRHPTDHCQCHLPASFRLSLFFRHPNLHSQVSAIECHFHDAYYRL